MMHFWITFDGRTIHGIGDFTDIYETVYFLRKAKKAKVTRVKAKLTLGQKIKLAFCKQPMDVPSRQEELRGQKKEGNMTYYTAHYGSWRDRDGVKFLGASYSRKEIFAKAQDAANELNTTVTIIGQRGMYVNCWYVNPKEGKK